MSIKKVGKKRGQQDRLADRWKEAEALAQGTWEGLHEICWMDGCVEEGGWTDKWTDGRMDRWME